MDMKLDLIAMFDPMKWFSFNPALAEEKMKEEEVAESHVPWKPEISIFSFPIYLYTTHFA